MEPEAVPPLITDGGPVRGTEGGPRTVKRFKHLKRSFVEVAADFPSFVEEVPVQCEDANWFEEDIVVDSDKEDEPNEREDGIPVVRFSKKGIPQAEGAAEHMQVEETQAPTPIAKHGAWMIVNRKSKGSERGPAKSTGKTKGDTKHNSTNSSNGTKAALNNTRTRDTVGGGHSAGNAAVQVPTVTNLQDLEGLQETHVLLDEETVSRGAPKPRNHRKNNKGNKQPTMTPGTSLGLTWNCGGVGNNKTDNHARLMMSDQKVGAFCFLETKTKDVSKIRKMAEKLGFDKHFIVDPLGFAGGLALFWRSSILDYSVIRHTSQAIHGIVSGLGTVVTRISFAYVRPNILAKDKLLTNEVRARRQLTDDSSCMVCGETCENVDHIFKHCNVARVCWRISQTPKSFVHRASSTFMQ
nr:LINE-type retrotransposon LIb DNA [Ipomoea batatas]